jgi:hypothetical protein
MVPLLGGKPRFYDEDSAWFEVSGHVSNSETESASGFQVANRAEQTRYGIEVLLEIE